MKEEEIIASGLLELYVMGALSEEDAETTRMAISQFPSLHKEIEEIEAALLQLSARGAGPVSPEVWNRIANSINNVKSLDHTHSRSVNWPAITGWAAAVLCMAGLFWMGNENNILEEQIEITTTENSRLEKEILDTDIRLAEAQSLLEVIRSKDFREVELPGNAPVAPSAFATVYYNETESVAYIDAKGLPTPPEGKEYQVWSLTLNPLTPTSIGLLSDFNTTETKFFKVENIPTPEAFGITLEPAGGSESPNLEQLYTLGTVSP